MKRPGSISEFLQTNFLHFNAKTLVAAAQEYTKLLEGGGRMMVTLAGAMSTAELGIILAEMIRQNKISAITCTGANLEEDLFNLVAHDFYRSLPHFRNLTESDEHDLLMKKFNRVTDTCIPEEEAIRRIERIIHGEWSSALERQKPHLPHEYFYNIIRNGKLSPHYQIPSQRSWLVAAAEADLPLFVPGWEDSTMGNIFAARCLEGQLSSTIIKNGIEYMVELSRFYEKYAAQGLGFFQIGGGIAGDFPICVAPLLNQDLRRDLPLWEYYCQISDSTTSFGSYSGANPSEKITWGKLAVGTPKFAIESDATIVVPLIFAHVLGW